jgi:predicted nucleic acid-binding protein
MFVLDTNVVSELREVHAGKANARLARWADGVDAIDLYLSAIVVLELETGVLRMERRDPIQGAALRLWLDRQVPPEFSGRVLPIDTEVARCRARLHVPDPRAERDALIAATAIVHVMTVVTWNSADFAPTGVAVLNPWDGPGPEGA